MSGEPSPILLTRPGCHLCDEVRGPLAALAALRGLHLAERSVESDPQSEARFGKPIPILLWDGMVIAEGRFSPQTAIEEVLARAARRTIR